MERITAEKKNTFAKESYSMEKVFFVFGRPTNRDLQAKASTDCSAILTNQLSFLDVQHMLCGFLLPHTAQATEQNSGNAPAVLAW